MNEDDYPTITPEEADDALFGPTGRQSIAKPVSIRLLWADIKQPRRIFPREVRGDWEGSPHNVPELLRAWHELVVAEYGAVDATKLVLGNEAIDLTHESEIVNDYFRLCQLAAGIAHEGLTNAITITTAHSGFFRIETGERRWLAHYLLIMYGDDRFEKIMARVVAKFDIYRQASENAAREPLNAVGTARQLALILMHMHRNQHIENWNTCVPAGHCDRNYYVQAAKLDIIRGDGGRVLAATGIKNRSMISRYKSILTLPDPLWLQADEENWTENRCREALETIRDAGVMERRKETDWIQSLEEDETQPDQVDDVLPVGNIGDEIMPGDKITTRNGLPGVVDTRTYDSLWADVWIDGNDHKTTLSIKSLTKADAVDTHKPIDDQGFDIDGVHYSDDLDLIHKTLGKSDGDELPDIQVGDRVELPGGAIVEIIMLTSDDNGVPMIRYEKDSGGQFNEYLEKIVMVGRNTVTDPVEYLDVEIDSDGKPVVQGKPTYSAADDLEMKIQFVDGDEKSGKYPDHYDPIAYMQALAEVGDLLHDEDNQESGADYVDPYVPESHEDAMPAINSKHPELAHLISALCKYYYDCEGIHDDDIAWALDDLLKSDGQIAKDQENDWGGVDPYRVRMKEIKKIVRLYLDQVSKNIDSWADELVVSAEAYHQEYWGDD